eukprot:CAMPEP_0197043022 /NCGR_PEP_ID=MMETSP1384-20130603/19311_1 /TAXON_ID=29189 /ORGANISM="Ammonia sp." /LENGTH=317 /DNA_ID=CAMNT_0042474241 /DNA_START=52 /DNA_END=1005 /DNA_ORIENTATION=+
MAEQKMDGREKLQLHICDCHHVQTKTMIEISRSKLSVSKLIDVAKRDLGLTATCKIYRENGSELTASNLYRISDDDSLYASDDSNLQGEYAPMNLCVMGPGAVGKSAITLRFIKGQFVANYDPTIEDAYKKGIYLDGNQLALDILDTAGQEDFDCLREQWMKNKDAFILVFSITKQGSLQSLQPFYDGIKLVYEDEVPPIILVGNKVDLDPNHRAYVGKDAKPPSPVVRRSYEDSDEELVEQEGREVSVQQAMEFAEKIGACHYVETSAKTSYNVENMVGKIVRHLVNIKYEDELASNKNKSNDDDDKKWWAKCTIL